MKTRIPRAMAALLLTWGLLGTLAGAADTARLALPSLETVELPDDFLLTATPAEGYIPMDVRFSATGADAYGMDYFLWDFNGDGVADGESYTPDAALNFDVMGGYVTYLYGYSSYTDTWYLAVATVLAYDETYGDSADGTGDGDAESEFGILTLTPSSASGDATLTVTFTIDEASSLGLTEYYWDWEGDWIYDETTYEPTTTVQYVAPGDYYPNVAAVDAAGNWYYGETTLAVTGTADTAGIDVQAYAYYDESETPPMTVEFWVSAPDDLTIEYCGWDYDNDGAYDEILPGDYTYWEFTIPGTYNVAWEAIDEYGRSFTGTIDLTLGGGDGGDGDDILAATPSSGTAPLAVDFSLAGIDASAAQEFWWDFEGDGEIDLVTDEPAASWVYGAQGEFTAYAYLVDWYDDIYYAATSVSVGANASAPVIQSASVTPASGTAPVQATLSCTASSPSGSTLYYFWDFEGDGWADQYTETGSLAVEYPWSGTYRPAVMVMDESGAMAEKSLGTLTVQSSGKAAALLVMPGANEQIAGLVTVVSFVDPPDASLDARLQYSTDGSTWLEVKNLPSWEDWMSMEEWEPGWYFGFLDASALPAGSLQLRTVLRSSQRDIPSAAVAVTVATGDADIYGWYDAGVGEQAVETKLDKTEKNTISVGNNATIDIPLQGFEGEGELRCVVSKPVNGGARSGDNRGRLREGSGVVGLNLGSADGNVSLKNRAEIKLRYNDADNDGKVDGTSVDETTLGVYQYDTSGGRWRKIDGSKVNARENLVTFKTGSMGDFLLSDTEPTGEPLGVQSTGSSGGGTPALTLTLDQSSLTPSDTLTLRLALAANGYAGQGDLYVAVVLPGGGYLCLSGPNAFGAPNTLAAMATGWTVSDIPATVLVQAPLAGAGAGTYTWHAILCKPGGNPAAAGDVVASTSAAMTIGP